LTGWLFKIVMFPYIMICVTVIFFSEDWHLRLIGMLRGDRSKARRPVEMAIPLRIPVMQGRVLAVLLAVNLLWQVIMPLRYLFYPGKLYWTEEGYRFSWRVMLMEKGGTAFFYVKDPATRQRGEVDNREFLTPLQERMMETQPDMILQFAHYLGGVYEQRGIKDPVVTVESYVTLNGSGSRLYIDSTVDLMKERESWRAKKWILPFKNF
jgi:hypothetical protein